MSKVNLTNDFLKEIKKRIKNNENLNIVIEGSERRGKSHFFEQLGGTVFYGKEKK